MKKFALFSLAFLALPLAAGGTPAYQPVRPIMSTWTMPPYPTVSRTKGEQGTSELLLDIDTNGSITECRIIGSSTYRLDLAACEYVKDHWKYQPATQNGKPTASTDKVGIVWGPDGRVTRR